jgi:hypothetical protein
VVTQVARGLGEDVMQQVGSHQQLRADAARLDQQANQLDPDRADPTELRAQAQGKSEQASELAPQLEQARQGSTYGGSGQSLADHQSAVGNLQQQRQAQQQSQTGAADEVTRLSGQLDGQRTTLSDTDRALQSVDTRLANQQTQPQQGSEVDDYIFRHGHGGVSSGNAMGGVGSTAKDFWQWWNASGEDGDKNREAFSAFVQRLLDLSGRIGRLLSTPAPPAEPTQPTQPTIGPAPAPQGQQQGGQPQLSALGLVGMSPGGGSTGDWASYGLGELMGRQTQDEVRQAGALRANVERLIALQPPAVVDEMNAHRINAMRAMQRYVALHDDAWRAYQGELAINAVINDTHAVRDLGNPVIEAADEELVCIEEGQEEEQRRKAAIESMNTDTPGMEGGMAALVAELVIKMADHGDRMEDGSPNTGSTSGEEVANAHTTASEESENQRDLAGQASERPARVPGRGRRRGGGAARLRRADDARRRRQAGDRGAPARGGARLQGPEAGRRRGGAAGGRDREHRLQQRLLGPGGLGAAVQGPARGDLPDDRRAGRRPGGGAGGRARGHRPGLVAAALPPGPPAPVRRARSLRGQGPGRRPGAGRERRDGRRGLRLAGRRGVPRRAGPVRSGP